MSYFVTINNKTVSLDNITLKANLLTGATTPFSRSTNYYGPFINVPDSHTINNRSVYEYFDRSLPTVSYSTINSGGDFGQYLPALATMYNATLLRNTFSITVERRSNDKSVKDDSQYTFYATTTYNETIPDIFNHISVICCGGGGGGGCSGEATVGNGRRGGGGGGGGWIAVPRIDLASFGRTITVQVGGGGPSGLGEFTGGYDPTNNTWPNQSNQKGGKSSVTSSNYGYIIANGGEGGPLAGFNSNLRPDSNAKPGSSNYLLPNNVSTNNILKPVPSNTSDSNWGETTSDWPSSLGGDCMINKLSYLPNISNYLKVINSSGNTARNGNNRNGIPAAGDTNNTSWDDTTNGSQIVYTYNNPFNTSNYWTYGGGGGGSAANNTGNGSGSSTNRPGSPGGPGAPGYVIIYKYLA